jgi:ATP-dependent protease ClpP protease subunit
VRRNPNFRPDPERGVFVNAVIDQDLLDRLTEQIVALQAQSRDPITVYIDSPGGSTIAAGVLERLLRAPGIDFEPPCRIVTVVTGTAASAAADLLSFGDYAIAYPESTVYFHGVRTEPAGPVTRETAEELSQYLQVRNDSYALALAKKSIGRILFLHLALRGEFAAYRAERRGRVSDLDCFAGVLLSKLGPAGAELVRRAMSKNAQYDLLIAYLERTAFQRQAYLMASRAASREAVLLKALIDFELKRNPEDGWTFRRDGLAQIGDDFLLLIEFIERRADDDLAGLCNRWADYFLSDQEQQELARIAEPARAAWKLDRLRPHLQPLWFFCVSLCQALQEGENELTAEEAYWLGLVDEVLGARQLVSMRLLVEAPAR